MEASRETEVCVDDAAPGRVVRKQWLCNPGTSENLYDKYVVLMLLEAETCEA